MIGERRQTRVKFSLVQAQLAIDAGPGSRVGGERVALLEAIRDHGSISAGARVAGIGFRSAWDAVTTLNNLFATPLVIAHSGGRDGGGAELSAEGLALIEAYRAVEKSLHQVVEIVAGAKTGMDEAMLEQFLWSVNMRTSARNALAGTITQIQHGAVDCEVILRLADNVEIAAVITERSAHELGLAVGKQVVALIKASFVILGRADEIGRTSARNRLTGTVVTREDTEVNTEIVLDLGGGKSLAAIITRTSADTLPLRLGDRACALIKSSHVILAMP